MHSTGPRWPPYLARLAFRAWERSSISSHRCCASSTTGGGGGHLVAGPGRGPQRHGGGPVAGPAPGHGRALRRHAVRAVVVAAQGPHFSVGLDLKAMGGMLTGGGVGRRRRTPSMAARARSGRPRCSGCRTPSPRWRAARSPSSPPCTATASAAASTSSPPATSGWPRPMRSSRSARPRWRSWPTSAACSGCRPSSAPGTWPSWPTRARTSARSGPRRSGWSTTWPPMPRASTRRPTRWR